MKEGPSLAPIAALAGDPARANMLTPLMDGGALTAGELARVAGVSAQTASAHLAKLEAGGVKIDRPYTKNEQTGVALAFITDPWGTYIELNERPKAVYLP